jgi:hypothetical protein
MIVRCNNDFYFFLHSAIWWSAIAIWALFPNHSAMIFHVARREIAVSGPQNLLIALVLGCARVFRCGALSAGRGERMNNERAQR